MPLIQFYGLRATRRWPLGEPKPDWEAEGEVRLHTVDLDPKDLQLKSARKKK